MRKTIAICLLVSFLTGVSFSQSKQHGAFRINGTINADTGLIKLSFFSEYHSDTKSELTTRVENGKFSFSGSIPSPESAFIIFKNSYVSSNFIIENGEQDVIINVDSSRKVPKVLNRIMTTDYDTYLKEFSEYDLHRKNLDKEYDKLRVAHSYKLPDSLKAAFDLKYKKIYYEHDKTLLGFVMRHPSSYNAFWKLINLMSWGYEPIYDTIYNSFATSLKSTYAGKVLYKKIANGRALSLGAKFPRLKSKNINNGAFSNEIFAKSKFSLVDFWFSNCGPCIAQFNTLRSLYSKYNKNGFDIIGISTDRTDKLEDCKKVIANEKLIWKQYWDENGKESARLSINVFPTNFLIDKNGVIVAKNISLEELDIFLTKNIK